MAYTIRQLSDDDAPAAHRLGSVTFGYADRPMPPISARPGRTTWGAFTATGELVAKAIDRQQAHWFGGRLVPASGVAGVAVAAEHRGYGVSSTLMTHLMAAARDRGAAIGTLFNTTPWPYRRVGWEEIGVLRTITVPAAALAGLRTPAGFTTRTATEADVPVLLTMYRDAARAGAAVMDRSAPTVDTTPAAVLAEYHGTTLALDAGGAVAGFCRWDRAGGYHADGSLTVEDLIASSPDALRTLLAMIGRWASVAPTIVLSLPPQDPALLVHALSHAPVRSQDPWMLRVIDAAVAVAARGWNPHVHGVVDLAIDDPAGPWNSGSYRLVVADGEGRLEAGGTGAVAVGPRGLALLYTGAGSPDALRRAGLLTGGDAATDALLSAAVAGPTPTLRDYF